MKPLIIIPVRGASQGIPRKALLPLGGISPLLRTIQTVRELGDVVVTTDDGEIAALASSQGIEVFHESAAVNPAGQRTVDTAVWQVVAQKPHELVATVQCTSPFLTARTVEACLYIANSESADSAVTVRDERSVAWGGTLEAPKLLTPWSVRQSLPPRWVITGGCVAAKRSVVTPARRFGGRLKLVEIGGAEALDLDEQKDWALAEWYSGAPSLRETLMARVLTDRPPRDAKPIVLSAWDEETDDVAFRNAALRDLTWPAYRPNALHTRAEAEIALQELTEWSDLVVLTSAYHQVRAFLTFLKVLTERGDDRHIRLWNLPAASRLDKLPQEWEKIRDYHAKGHVASIEDGLAYINWRDAKVPCAI